ncbi:MAG: Rid family detoxifying hydrolase [Pseudomonadota bacterium]|nr:Rid family detoxifying hydrolase [Pseudomonadota bacterium]
MSRDMIMTPKAPSAIGTYSQAIKFDTTIYISGQIPLDPVTGEIVQGGIEAEIKQVFSNLNAIAEAAGTSLSNTLKLTIYLKNLENFSAINKHMAEIFTTPYPARAALEVSALPKNANVEADAIVAM